MEQTTISPLRQPLAMAGTTGSLMGAGLFHIQRGSLVPATACLGEAVSVFESRPEPHDAVQARLNLAFVGLLGGDKEALTVIETEVAGVRAAGSDSLLVDSLGTLGRALLLVGDVVRARALFVEALALTDVDADPSAKTHVLVGLGRAEVGLGAYAAATEALAEGLEQARRDGERHAAGVALAWLGESARLCGDLDEATCRFAEAVGVAIEAGYPYPLAQGLIGQARVAFDAGAIAEAAHHFEEALAVARASQAVFLLAPSLCGMAAVSHDPPEAQVLLAEAAEIAERCLDRIGQALVCEQEARMAIVGGRDTQAVAAFGKALGIWSRVGDPAALARVAGELGCLAVAVPNPQWAEALLAWSASLRLRHGYVLPPADAARFDDAGESSGPQLDQDGD